MMRLVFTDKRQFILTGVAFSDRDIPRKAGFRFDAESKTWYAPSPREAVRLREYADPSAENELSRLTLSFSLYSGPLPHPKGLKPHPHQFTGAQFSLSRNRSYLAFAPRLGKSIMSALIRNALDTPTVFIAPPFLTRNAEAEFLKWSTGSPAIVRYDSREAPVDTPDILIVPDSLIHREGARAEIKDLAVRARRAGKKPLLIADEVHRFKTFDAIRTRALFGVPGKLGLIDLFPRQVYLSGTPMRRPAGLYPLLSKAAPQTIDFASYEEYGLKFCAGKIDEEKCPKCGGRGGFTYQGKGYRTCPYCKGAGKFKNGYDFSGGSNLEELRERLLDQFMLRVKTVPGLPPKTEEIVLIGDLPPKLLKREKAILAKVSPEDLVADRVSSDHVSVYRRELGQIKVKPALDFLRSLLEESDEKVIVFAFHKDVIASLARGLKEFSPLVIDGDVSKKARREIEVKFQSDKGSRLLVANYIAAGLGLTTPADRAVFVEFSWSKIENDQAGDRGRVIGGKDLYVQYLVYADSIDRKTIEINLKDEQITAYI